ncbi:MAG: 1-deoxypentalenic acid 11-beta-hydroxylase [Chloroflexi bacterium ADurb.Bin325]|nr:MAG: 1-deoxypentalenic acid 11-beta-hydroxylase [Chloroflexi bacterium ADurb.Bin325]
MTDRLNTLELTSNGFALDMSPRRIGWLTPSDPARPYAELWEQYRAQGYLWLKGILDRRAVLDFRRRFFAAFAELGLLAAGSDPEAGLYAGGGEDAAACHKQLVEATRWAAYEAFCLMAPIRDFYEAVLGGPVYLHGRKIIRYSKPGDRFATPAHYDLTYLRAGTERVYTSWIPIGDTPVEMGGLIYLEGSDGWGREIEAELSAKNADLPPEERISAYNRNMAEGGWLTKDAPSLAERQDTRWLAADYEAGDMVVHSGYMIHAATQNVDDRGRIRLSTDIRYQLVRDPIDQRWAKPWSPGDNL